MSNKLRVFIDADVLFAGSASPTQYGASHVVLRMAEITLIEAITSRQVITEAERNLAEKLPDKLTEFRLIVSRCLRVVSDPSPDSLKPYESQADPKDLPILVAALREECAYLLTFNLRHFHPQGKFIIVQRPGDFLLTVRSLLTGISIQ
ncbi:MAG: hypothetical protein DRI77_09935 [Chloroflexi bacterium]|nr:MAG: hypothetical protein DRI77_09935 [Chloroflexota bacterium]